MRTMDVAVQAILPPHWRWTWRVWTMGDSIEADWIMLGVGCVTGSKGDWGELLRVV